MRRRRASRSPMKRHPILLLLFFALLSTSASPFAAAFSDEDDGTGVDDDRDDEDGYDVWPEERSLLNPERADKERAAEEERCPAACLCNDATHSAACDADGDDLAAFLSSAAKLLHSSNRVFINNFRAGGALTPDSLPSLSLSELSLTGGVLPALAGNATFSTFDRGNRLARLDLSGNSLAAVGSDALSGLPNLRLLRLSDNSLTTVPEIRLPSLVSLSLRGNRLTELNARCLAGTPSLRSVDLSSNRVAHVAPTALHGLSALTRLILTDNPLLHLERLDAFGAARLRVVDVSRAGLSRVPSTLARSVRDLRVEGNNIGAIRRGDLDPYPLVERLSLDANRIDVVEEDALGRLEVLTRLRLGGNRLRAVPRSLPTVLRHLHLQDNRMVALRAGDLHGLSRLETLDLSSNEIREVEAGALASSPTLHVLSLKSNQLSTIPAGTFKRLRDLTSLDLSNNPIKHLESSTFESLTSLKELRLSGAGSAEADAAELFAPLASLKTMDLSGSPWLAVALTTGGGDALRPLRGLRDLDLSRCGLHSLPSDIPFLLPELRLVTLAGNEWYCHGKEAESAFALSEWIREPGETVILEADDIRCTLPEHLRSRPMAMLREDDFGIPPTTQSTTIQTESTSTPNPPTTTPLELPSTTGPSVTDETSLIHERSSNETLINQNTDLSKGESKLTVIPKKIKNEKKFDPNSTAINDLTVRNTLAESVTTQSTPKSTEKFSADKTDKPIMLPTTEKPVSTTTEISDSKKVSTINPLDYKAVKFNPTTTTIITSTTRTTDKTHAVQSDAATIPSKIITPSTIATSSSSSHPTQEDKTTLTPIPFTVSSASSPPPPATVLPSSESPSPDRGMSQALARSGVDEAPEANVITPSEVSPHAVHAAAPITLGLLGTCALLAAVGALYRRGRGMNGGGVIGGVAARGGGSAGPGNQTSSSGRRSSASIAYRPHRDEVSIATVVGDEEEDEEGVGERRKGLPYSRPVALW
ncbi:uncharacterized protein [Hetaerina americana]|uniref:uncharacterized protein n=1 Tax=Hetaerina americana TaxID=62018 RepID=UPI003A7F445C